MSARTMHFAPEPGLPASPGAPVPAAGYHGPGTDLGEDIRLGVIGRAVEAPPLLPAPADAHEFRRPGGWGSRLREGWRGIRREPR